MAKDPDQTPRYGTRNAVPPAAFVRQLLIVACFFAVLNVAVQKANINSRSAQLLHSIDTRTRNKEYDALYVGHSLMEAGINEEVIYKASGIKPFGAGLGSTSPLQHLLIVQHIRRISPREKIPLVVYGFFGDQLSMPPSKSSMGNFAMNYQVEPQLASQFVADNLVEKAQFQLTTALPYLNQQSWVWSQVEKLRRKLESIGTPPVATNQFGRAADFAALTGAAGKPEESFPKHLSDLMRMASADADAPRQRHGVIAGSVLSEPVREMIEQMKPMSTRLVFVCMPLSAEGRRTFNSSPEWDRYKATVTQELQREGITVIDASEWVKDKADDGTANFGDIIHLSQSGAKVFSQRLGETLKQLP